MGNAIKSGQRRRVLVVEDSAPLRALIADVLALEGFAVTEAQNAVEMEAAIALSELPAATQGPYDLVVTDVRMPGKSGLDALRTLRSRGVRSRFVVITAFPEDATEQQIRGLDAHLLPKPFAIADLCALTKTALLAETAEGAR
jgi:DNA-binding response OmpR family regulator